MTVPERSGTGRPSVGMTTSAIEVARARVRATAVHRDPVEMEAAARAYVLAAHLALLARLAARIAAMPPAILGRLLVSKR